MNISPGMAPSSPVLLSPSLTRRPPSPGRRSPPPFRSPPSCIMTSPKLWQKAAISRLAEEFFWIGGSIVATPKLRMGQIVERCMCNMQAGTQMIKLRGKSKALVRLFYLDEHKSCIRWRPSRKHEKAKITIDSIHEVCEGIKTEVFRRFANNKFDPNCCFSIYHGDHVESLDLVSTNGEEARTWITGLKYLMAGISDEDSLAKRQRTRDQWLRQTFSEADKNGDGNLSIGEVLQLLHKLNVNLPKQKVKEMFEEADRDDKHGSLTFEEFCTFYKMISTRRELYLLMITYSNHKEHMDFNDLIRFLENEQKMANVSREYCKMIINQFEPCPENQANMVMGIDGFTNYLRSPAGDIFNPEHYKVNQDMTHPLTHYYIASSHNTYLTGDQLLSQSRVDMYAYVLQAGCRCIEVDCWDGPDGEPIVHHGYTLTSKILFKEVIETINKYAFAKSQYPVILSIENHCTVPQQKKMAQYLTEVLQDKLDLSNINVNESRRMPSPEVLKGKVLVKGKKLAANIDADAEEGDVSDDDDSAEEEEEEEEQINGHRGAGAPKTCDESNKSSRRLLGSFRRKKKKRVKIRKNPIMNDSDIDQEISSSNDKQVINYGKRRKTMRLSRALSDLVKYTKSVHVHDIETQAYMCSWQVSSLNESITNQILHLKPTQLVRFNQRQLLRVYPSNYRVDSSNFNPQPFWNAGCHLVALNYQTEGRMLQLNRAKFAANGNCGYVLKPKCMCKGAFNPALEDPLPGHRKTQLVLKIISGQQLPKPKDSMLGDRGEIIDPFVEVEIIGLSVDCNKHQTRVVDDNGFNPMWEETLVFMLHMPQIALVRFMVWDHDPIGRDFIGQRTIAFKSMLPGYRHVYLEGMVEASIFVHVAINDITGKVKSSNAVKQLFQRNLMYTSKDGTRRSFGPNFLRKGGAEKSQAKPKRGSCDSCAKEDILNRRYSDDISSKDSRSTSQSASLLMGAQSEPLRRARKVSFQEPEGFHVVRRRLSSITCSSGRGMAMDYTNLGFDSKESSELDVWTPLVPPCHSNVDNHEMTDSKQNDLPPVFILDSITSDQQMWSQQISGPKYVSKHSDQEQPVNNQGPAVKLSSVSSEPTRDCEPLIFSPIPDGVLDPSSGALNTRNLPLKNKFRPLDFEFKPQWQPRSIPATPAMSRRSLNDSCSKDSSLTGRRSQSVPRRRPPSPPNTPFNIKKDFLHQFPLPQKHGSCSYVTQKNSFANNNNLAESELSSTSSLDSLDLSTLPSRFPDNQQPTMGTLQREMNALFEQKMHEIRCNSPIFFRDSSTL
ncbi:1-phosphatidylinositol 4,5-bisphosphate phosphodiesterase eta-2 [Triplophysa dalaica]|uniref:1-phosphatidylinositol 4,5-bisphosphate phosphodiesterase eta-2 n=1 Tax=Triplophysa dalaica TaxID=1582913 RepID=UPI0024DF6BD8|nr:1-phosphatidylinositol 4,5-bisphosphate phosphodiesterase eta-2 [Triplophysa dalaica]